MEELTVNNGNETNEEKLWPISFITTIRNNAPISFCSYRSTDSRKKIPFLNIG